MTLQIERIVLYGTNGEIRQLRFKLGGLNVITGNSRTGKSSIIDIVDYCTGRGSCHIADGVIRRHVSWFAVVFQLGEGQIFVARRNPSAGRTTSPDVFLLRSSKIELPPVETLSKNTTVDGLKDFLTSTVGIRENENRPREGETRRPLRANIRHALLFCLQDQRDIDSRETLFHRQSGEAMALTIRDVLPYFLGAVDEEQLLAHMRLDAALKELNRLQRAMRGAGTGVNPVDGSARQLLDEARLVGLTSRFGTPNDDPTVLDQLRDISTQELPFENPAPSDSSSIFDELQTVRMGLVEDLEKIRRHLWFARDFFSTAGGFQTEAAEQQARLRSMQLIATGSNTSSHCPLCDNVLNGRVATIDQLSTALSNVQNDLQAVNVERPRIAERIGELESRELELIEQLRQVNGSIRNLSRQNLAEDNLNIPDIRKAWVQGRISQFVESLTAFDQTDELSEQIASKQHLVEMLSEDVDYETDHQNLDAFVSIVSDFMTQYSERLQLEHRGSRLRLDAKKLTVVADTIEGAVPLNHMGSGENWVGYHVLTHLALHRWFTEKSRPVPRFLILDQPSQAYFPPERKPEDTVYSLPDEDRLALQRLFQLIHEVTNSLEGKLQVILLDHARLTDSWFTEAIVEEWREENALVPQSWIT